MTKGVRSPSGALFGGMALLLAMVGGPAPARADFDGDRFDEVVYSRVYDVLAGVTGSSYWAVLDDKHEGYRERYWSSLGETALQRASQIVAADIDGDTVEDVVMSIDCVDWMGYYCPYEEGPRLLVALSRSGTVQAITAGAELPAKEWASGGAVCELDGKPGREIVLATNGALPVLRVYSYDFESQSLVARERTAILGDRITALACGDFDGVGLDQVVLSRNQEDPLTGRFVDFYFWGVNGGFGRNDFAAARMAEVGADCSTRNIITAEVDGDARRELVMACGGVTQVLDDLISPVFLLGREYTFPTWVNVEEVATLAAGDADGDGIDEILIGGRADYWVSSAWKRVGAYFVVKVANATLNQISDVFYSRDTDDFLGEAVPTAAAFGDLDGDGQAELVVALSKFGGGPATLAIHDDVWHGFELQEERTSRDHMPLGGARGQYNQALAIRGRSGARKLSKDGCCYSIALPCAARTDRVDPTCNEGAIAVDRVNRCGAGHEAACLAEWGTVNQCVPSRSIATGGTETANGIDDNCDNVTVADEICDGIDQDGDGRTDEDAGSCILRALFIPVCWNSGDEAVKAAVDRWMTFFEDRGRLQECGRNGAPKKIHVDTWPAAKMGCVSPDSDHMQIARQKGLDTRDYDFVAFVKPMSPSCAAGMTFNGVGMMYLESGGFSSFPGEYVTMTHEFGHMTGLGDEYKYDVGKPNTITAALGCDPANCCNTPYPDCVYVDHLCFGNYAADVSGLHWSSQNGVAVLTDESGAAAVPPLFGDGRCVMTNASGKGWNVAGNIENGVGTHRSFCPLCLEHWRKYGPKCIDTFPGQQRRIELGGHWGPQGKILLSFYDVKEGRVGPVTPPTSDGSRVEVWDGAGNMLGSFPGHGYNYEPGRGGNDANFWVRYPVSAAGGGPVRLISYVDNVAVDQVTAGGRAPVAAARVASRQCSSSGVGEVTLDASGSYDPDGDTLRFAWEAPGVTLSDPSSATPTGAFPIGTTTVRLTVSDGAGGSSSVELQVVADGEAPKFVALPASVVLAPCGAQPDLGKATAIDACDGEVVVTNDAPSEFPVGTTTVTWKATDHSGNTATYQQSVIVRPVVDLGEEHTVSNAANNACLRITRYPSSWAPNVHSLIIQPQGTGSGWPIPFTWSNCGASGADSLPAPWQQGTIRPVDTSCRTDIELGGDGAGVVALTWWANG